MLARFSDSPKTLRKALVIAMSFSSFKGTTHADLLKIPVTYNKNEISLLSSLIG